MRRLFNSFKNNSVILEINTKDIKVVKDEVNCFELKTFLASFKNFISNFDTILDGFDQKDIEEEIRRHEELLKFSTSSA
ncbi:unnamed protein product [Caenorhabditis brenneri]